MPGFIDYLRRISGSAESGLIQFAEAVLTGVTEDEAVNSRIDEVVSLAENRKNLAQTAQRPSPYWVKLAECLAEFKRMHTTVEGSQEGDTSSLITKGERLSGPMADVYQRAGLNNNANPLVFADNKSMQLFIGGLLEKLGELEPSFGKLQILEFDNKKGDLNEVFLRGWPTDLYKVYLAFQALPQEQQVKSARAILDYTKAYFNLDAEAFRGDIPVNPLTPFSFKNFTVDALVNGAVKKGHLRPSMNLAQITTGIVNGTIELTPQGTLLFGLMADLIDADTTLAAAIGFLQKINIHAPQDNAKNNPMLVGDGLSGEQGAHFVASDYARPFDIAAPDVTRDASMVTAAYRYLKLFQAEHLIENKGLARVANPYVNAGRFFVGAANVAEPLAFAQTLGQVINGAAIYLSLAYAPRLEIPVVLGGALAAQALGDKVAGVLRLQSPTTMHQGKNDLTPKQGFAYAFAQWIKDLAALVEADDKKHTSNHVWPIVRTVSVRQNKFFNKLLEHVNEHVDRYGIRSVAPQEGGEKISEPLSQLIDALKEQAENAHQLVLTADHTEGLRTHKYVTMIIIGWAMAAIKLQGIKDKLLGRSSKTARPERMKQEAKYTLEDGAETVARVQDLKKKLKSSKGFLAEVLVPKGALTLIQKGGVDANHEATMVATRKSIFGLGVLEHRLGQAGSFPLMLLEEIRKTNPNRAEYYLLRDQKGNVVEVGLFEPVSGGRFGFRMTVEPALAWVPGVAATRLCQPDVEMFIKGPKDHPGAEIVMPYRFDADKRDEDGQRYAALTAQVSNSLNSGVIGINQKLTAPKQAEFYDKAESVLGLKINDSVTGISQNVVGEIIKILAEPNLGFDLSSLTIDSLDFRGNVAEFDLSYEQSFEIRTRSKGEKTDAAGKSVAGEFVTGSIITRNVSGEIVNEVGVKLFIKGNQGEGEVQRMQQPKPNPLGVNGVGMNLTAMSLALWQKFVALGGDPNVIHTIDLAGTATGAKGAFAPGFGLAVQIETKLRQKFGAMVDELKLSFFGRVGPDMNYEMRVNPASKTEPHFDLQVIKKGDSKKGKKDEVVIDGSFKLKYEAPRLELKQNDILQRGAFEIAGTAPVLPLQAHAVLAGMMNPAMVRR